MAKKAKKTKTEKKKRGFFAALFSPIDDAELEAELDAEELEAYADELSDEELDELTDEELEAYYDGLSDEELEAYDDELTDEELEEYEDELTDEELEEYEDEFTDEELEEYEEEFTDEELEEFEDEPTDDEAVSEGPEPDDSDLTDNISDEAVEAADAENRESDAADTESIFEDEGDFEAVGPNALDNNAFTEAYPEDASSAEGGETDVSTDPLEPEKIVLHRPETYQIPPAVTTRFFMTGASTVTRIHLKETETLRTIDAIRRKSRAAAEKKQKEQQKKRETVFEKLSGFIKRTAGGFLFTIAIIAALLAAGYYFFLLSDIRITGLSRTLSDAEIAQLTGLYRREHILLIDLDEVRETISANPYMQVNDIEYVFPARIRIDLSERTQAAAIIGLDYNVIIDENGYVLSMSPGEVAGLIQITGISMSGIKLGQRIGETSDFTTASLISIIGKLKEYGLMGKIRSLDMTTPLAIVMYTYNGFQIQVGQPTDLDSKFSTLAEALPRAEAARCYTGTLYLSSKGGAVYSPSGAEAAALESASTDANAIHLESGYEYGMYSAPDAEGNIQQGQSYSTSNGVQQQPVITNAVPDSPDDFQG